MDAIHEAKHLFNDTWDLMDKGAERTKEDDALMLHKAHTSCYLWRSAEQPVNNARGEWQVSRVYSVLGSGEFALLHGQLSLDICLEHDISGQDLAFGYEAVARAKRLLGDTAGADEAQARGLAACEAIDDAGERAYTEGELKGA